MKYHVERSIIIKANMEAIRSLVEDFSRWSDWSPWTVIEPDCQMELGGSAGQPGHSMRWDGKVIGSGQNVLRSNDNNTITYDLEFFKPFKSKAVTGFRFDAVDGGVKVTWVMDSKMPWFLFFLAGKMKAWVGMDYDRGLAMMKAVAEQGSVPATTVSKGVVDLVGFSYIGIKRTVAMKDMKQHMGSDFGRLMQLVEAKGVSAKNWISLYPKFNMVKQEMTYIAAISDENLQGIELGPEYVRGAVAGGKALEIIHTGSYDYLGNAWSMGMMHMRAKKLKKAGIPFEQYWNNPKTAAPSQLSTSIIFPVRG